MLILLSILAVGRAAAADVIFATPAANTLTGTNPTRGFTKKEELAKDKEDVWVPWRIDIQPAPKNVKSAAIRMYVRPIGGDPGTDQLILKGKSGTAVVVKDNIYAADTTTTITKGKTKDDFMEIKVDLDLTKDKDVIDAIKTGTLEGVIQDDSSVESVQLEIDTGQ
jgi:hypothetical protein